MSGRMNLIAPVFEPRFADFASANQDVIRRAMERLPCATGKRLPGTVNAGAVAVVAKGYAFKRAVMAQIEPGQPFTLQDLTASLAGVGIKSSRTAIRNVIGGLYTSGEVEREWDGRAYQYTLKIREDA
jgi:hypothetical protein